MTSIEYMIGHRRAAVLVLQCFMWCVHISCGAYTELVRVWYFKF